MKSTQNGKYKQTANVGTYKRFFLLILKKDFIYLFMRDTD